MVPQRSDRLHYSASFEPAQKAVRLLRDYRLGFAHCLDADLEIVLDDVGKVVDAVEKYVVELGRLRFDVARDRQIDDEQRRVPARLGRSLDQSLAENRQRARRRGDDEVELHKAVWQL